MIKVYKLNKRFNKHKRNEIHVLKDITLEFPDTGLVFLLGPSGSGKSTLLNAIGGLDKVDSGNVVINDNEISKYKFNQWDYLRNQHIGYIFQNYILFPELSVYENIAFALRLIGASKEESDERIEYALKAVKMEKYKKRKVKNLSGGQQQRIAIARALVKSPDVIIADEPTGNLDTNNTNQIMNIIKKISKNCLVVMVTHETRLAQFYGDRIIEIKDGEIISDYINNETKVLQGTEDRNLYLQDLSSDNISGDNISINYFYQEEKPQLNLNVIFKDNTFYIHSFNNNVKIKFLSKGDEIKVIDGKKAPITMETIDEINYSLDKISNPKSKYSVISIKDAIKMSFTRLRSLRWFQKFFLMTFCLIAIMLVISVASFFGTFKFDDHSIIYEDRHYLFMSSKTKLNVDDEMINKYLNLIGEQGVVEYSKYNFNFSFKYDIFQQVKNSCFYFSGSLVSIDQISSKDIIIGSMPINKEDIVIDKWVIDIMFSNNEVTSAGLLSYGDFIDKPFYYNNNEFGKIVGVVDTNNPSIYIDDLMRVRLQLATEWIQDYYLDKIGYKGTLNPGEVLVNTKYKLNDNKIYIGDDEFTVKDTFEEDSNIMIIFNNNDMNELLMRQLLTSGNFTIYSSDKEETIKHFESLGFEVYDNNLTNLRSYLLQHKSQLISQVIFTVVVLLGSLIFMYFIMRSSLFSRVYEMGVYRALGVTRRDIYKIFICEITIISLFTSFIGWLLTSVVIHQAIKGINFTIHIYYPLYLSVLTLAFIYVVNIINGLLPIFTLLRKTPAQILTKYDI